MLFYISLGTFAGVVVFGLLFIIMGLRGGPWKLPGIGMMVCFLALIVSVVLPRLGIGGENLDTAGEPSGAVESEDVGGSEAGEPEEIEGTIIVDFDVSVVGDPGKPEFQIKTNLPDETELMLTLKGENFTGQAKVTVENGEATSEAFSSKGDTLSGDYSLTISMSIPRLQSDYVRSVIGEKGEYIDGPYVENSEITGENVVSATFEVEIVADSRASVEADSNQDVMDVDLDLVMDILRITLAQNFGEDNYTLEYDDKSVTINVWQDGVAAGSVYAAAGDSTAKAAWEVMIEGQKFLCNSVVEQIETAGAQDYYVMINVLNDLDKSKTLLSILNGTIVYDAVND